MEEVSRIPKNGKNAHFNYKYATESDIVDGIRPLLAKHGLALFVEAINSQWRGTEPGRGGPIVTVELRYTLGCSETGATITTTIYAEGQDPGDKAYYKAYSGGMKYFLSKTFLISTGDDPERDDEQPRQQNQKPQTTAKAANAEADYRRELRGVVQAVDAKFNAKGELSIQFAIADQPCLYHNAPAEYIHLADGDPVIATGELKTRRNELVLWVERLTHADNPNFWQEQAAKENIPF
jgi:hypothetical protein